MSHWDKIQASIPVDRKAAMGIGHGDPLLPSQNDVPGPVKRQHSKNDLVLDGVKFGRFVVIGTVPKSKSGFHKTAKYLCRCVCGNYETHRAKKLRRSENPVDRCFECRKLLDLKREEFSRRNGFAMSEEDCR